MTLKKITAVKGFNDILPAETAKWQVVERLVREVFFDYGYSEIRVPIVEKTQVFTRSIGETTDIVEKEMYTFHDKKDASMTLRPEGTAPVVRAYIQNALHSKSPVNKLYYMGPMFRYERPQKGRYRQFHQVGAELFGDSSPMADAELLSMVMHLFSRIGLTGLTLNINSLGCKECRVGYINPLRHYFSNKIGELCDNCRRRLNANPLRILDCKAHSCKELITDAPLISKYLCTCCHNHFVAVRKYLDDLDVKYVVDDRMVRGLDYYTKTTFEVTTDMLGAQNAVAAGGRYDDLCEQFGGLKTPAVGFALGVERLILLLDDKADYADKPDIFIAAIGDAAKRVSFGLLDQLRKKGISCEMEFSGKSLKSQLRRADKGAFRYVLIIGEDELKNASATLRDMSTKEQVSLSLDSAVRDIEEILSA